MPEENQATNQSNKPNQESNQATNQPNQNQNQFRNRDFKRHTAYRLFIGMISQGKPEFQGERFLHVMSGNKNVVRVNIIANIIDKFLSEQKPYCALTIDDGTGTIRIKAFSDSLYLIKDLEQGDTVNVVGRLGYYNDEIYILPEIVKNSSITWLIARKLELEKEYGQDIVKRLSDQQRSEQIQEYQAQKQAQQPQQQEQATKQTSTQATQPQAQQEEQTTEEKIDMSENENKNEDETGPDIKTEIITKIKESEPEGIDIDKIIMSMNKPVDNINKIITDLLESGEIYEPKPGRLRIL